MLSLGTIGLTGAAMYGGIKALRRYVFQDEKRPLWLKSPQPMAVAAGADASAATATIDADLVTESAGSSAAIFDYVVHNEEGRKLSIIALSGTTAALHILLGVQAGIPLFVWNGAGFVAFAAGQYFVPQLEPYRRDVRDGFLAYTGTTIVAYFLVNGAGGFVSVVGMTTKLVEAGLLALLWQEAETE